MRFLILLLISLLLFISNLSQKNNTLLALDKPVKTMCWGNPWALSDTTKWNFVYNNIDVLKIYINNIDTRLGQDTVRSFIESLLKKNIKIAIEIGGLLDWQAKKKDQSAEASFQQEWAKVKPLIDLIRSIDPQKSIDMLDMDGPIRRMLFPQNVKSDYHTLESAVNELFEVVKMWQDSVPGIKINLLTNFPNWAWKDTPAYFSISGETSGYGQYLDVLYTIWSKSEETGIYFDGLTIDNPYDYALGLANSNQEDSIKDVDWMDRIGDLVTVAHNMNLKVNFIFNTNGARTAKTYSEQTLEFIDLYHQQIGIPDGYWIQSWYQLPDAWLPEDEPFTMTNITLNAIKKINTGEIPLPGKVKLLLPENESKVKNSMVILKWKKSRPVVTNYQLQVFIGRAILISDSTLTDTTFDLTGLEEGNEYTWNVRAENSGGWGEWSDIWKFTYKPDEPQPDGKNYWGLRNLVMNYPEQVYEELNPQLLAFGFVWDRVENPNDNFSFSGIDRAIDFCIKYNSKAVFLLTPASSWASDGEPKAPIDLDRSTPLDEVPERGFSEYLYDYAYSVVDRAEKRSLGTLKYLRYGNEPQFPDHWKISDSTYKQDVEDYLRCLRTVYVAAHKAAEDNGTDIMVSHGGFYYDGQLERIWFDLGERNPRMQDSLLTLFNSRHERQWPQTIYTWENFKRRQNTNPAIPSNYWMDVIAGQTDWLDWFDIHYHFKPRFIFDDMKAFEKAVIDSGGTIKPWLAAEAAMQLEEAGETGYEARFHAADMVRKWIFGIDAGLQGICTPVIGWPPDRFFGLYSDNNERYLSADAYQFIHSLIEPKNIPENKSENNLIIHRFREDNNIVDVVWLDALFDTVSTSEKYTPSVPEEYAGSEDGYYGATVYNILGEKLADFDIGDIPSLEIDQEPVIIVWDVTIPHKEEFAKFEPPDGFIYHGVGWNYQNSVPNYLEMMPENEQPLLFQTMSAIPGTRPLTVNKVLGGLRYAWMDPDKQFTEYGVHFQRTQDEPFDSIFAYTNELDDLIDTLAMGMKQHGKPFFLRIGGEMNGNWNNYTPYIFPKAFRKLVLELRRRGVNNFATVWCYEPAAAADFADSTELGWKWYPGDDVVDWFGLDVFPLKDFDPNEPDTARNGMLSTKGKSELFLKFARERGFPVYINETTSHSENIIPDNEDPGNVEGEKIWNHWFVPFFTFLADHKEIKAFNYINLDWRSIEKWKTWGDCRLEINTYIKRQWIEELDKPKYIHKGYSIDGTVDVEGELISGNGFEIYPNPARDYLYVKLPEDPKLFADYSIYIYNSFGNIVLSSYVDHMIKDYRINLKDFPNGIYLINVVNNDIATLKFTVVK